MSGSIEQLIELEALEVERDALRRQRDEAPAALAEVERRLAQATEQRAAIVAEQTAARHGREQREKDIGYERTKLDDRERKLRQVRNNEEYQAGMREIDEQRKRIVAMEDEVLASMVAVEELDERIAEVAEAEKRARADQEARQAEVSERVAVLDRAIEARDARIAEVRPKVEATMLARYDRIRGSTGTTALAEVEGGICAGCRVGIPPQMYNELHDPAVTHTCPTCDRILYVRVTEAGDGPRQPSRRAGNH